MPKTVALALLNSQFTDCLAIYLQRMRNVTGLLRPLPSELTAKQV